MLTTRFITTFVLLVLVQNATALAFPVHINIKKNTAASTGSASATLSIISSKSRSYSSWSWLTRTETIKLPFPLLKATHSDDKELGITSGASQETRGELADDEIIEKEEKEEEESFDWCQQWYPLLPLKNLEGLNLDQQPLGMTILGQDLVIWKTTAPANSTLHQQEQEQHDNHHEYSVFQDTCPHRRAQLSTGRVLQSAAGTTLSCRYHGWEFDAKGRCTRIPMMKDDTSGTTVKSKAFCVASYPTKSHQGLLWVYMDPTNPHPPSLSSSSLSLQKATSTNTTDHDNDNSIEWAILINPISWQTMIENSFDPSHAPFIHELPSFLKGKGFSFYTPQGAIPMDQYQLVTDLTKNGFALQHSPYHVLPGMTTTNTTTTTTPAALMTTRDFAPPVTQHTDSPMFYSTLHFVPMKPGYTLTLGRFQMKFQTQSTKQNPARKLPTLSSLVHRLVPAAPRKRLQSILDDAKHFKSLVLNDANHVFINQDWTVMHAQDSHKTWSSASSNKNKKSIKWNDMYPTKSDVGVRTMQMWSDKFGQKPHFTMPALYYNDNQQTPSPPQLQPLSPWEYHAKYCPQCQRSIQRVARLQNICRRVSRVSLMGGGVIAAGHFLVMSAFRRSSLNRVVASAVFMVVSWVMIVSLLMLSVATRYMSQTCSNMLEQTFVSPQNIPKYQMMPIYANARKIHSNTP